MAQQLGGWRGLVESGIPVLVFVVTDIILGRFFAPDDTLGALGDKPALKLSILASVGVAVLMAAVRLGQGKPIRFAVNGLFGIALGAVLAWRSGEARSFYLP